MKLQIAVDIIVAMVILTGFSAASSTGDTSVEGNIGDEFQLSVDVTHGYLSLAYNTQVELPANLIVSSNGPWQVTVKSDDDTNGKMSEWSSTAGYIYNGYYHIQLQNPMQVIRDVGGQYPTTLTKNDQVLITQQNNYGNDLQYPIKFIQPMGSSGNDQRLAPPHMYHILVTFTGTMSY